MKPFNYFETLTEKQIKKLNDKKGALLYYEWFGRLYENLDLETIGAMLLGVIFYDMHAGSKPIPAKLMKVIKKDKTATVLFDALLERTYAGSREWINRHHSSKQDEKTSEKSEKRLIENTDKKDSFENSEGHDDLPF